MPKKPLILVGGGGHCVSCIDAIESSDEWEILGILEREATAVGRRVLGYSVLGTNEAIPMYVAKGYYFLVTVGQIKSAATRRTLTSLLEKAGARMATVVAAKSIVSQHATLGEGTIVHHFSVVNAGAVVGKSNILNTGSIIEHDVTTGDFCHISTSAVLNGNVKIGNNCFIGSGVVVLNGLQIADEVVLGAGAIVTKSIHDSGIYAGVPNKKIK
ncbi:acetyltransferase [uncultured Chitinophaga sp.]|uniref:acetyltransferase n=1 Tax=uncultured Chitinophaga sp. TaxID=339340 RepID=UPI0025CE77E9|nr:acetyltransferase [uncultured Chitinophaga sp.]